MVKSRAYKFLIIVLVASLFFNVVMVVLTVIPKEDFSEIVFSEADFPLEVDLSTAVFYVGDKVSGTATITNKSGKDVTVFSNGHTPCIYLHKVNTTSVHVETDAGRGEVLKAGGKMTSVFNREVTEAGTYVLYVHYNIRVNGRIELCSELEDIIIEVK
ncbi:MAG: hypothetical protein FWD52_08950 [Candidatus Bathyarchaeota archaeon]|nr:hypothetical protein [Candidatus Termiticorpusculum sp.]